MAAIGCRPRRASDTNRSLWWRHFVSMPMTRFRIFQLLVDALYFRALSGRRRFKPSSGRNETTTRCSPFNSLVYNYVTNGYALNKTSSSRFARYLGGISWTFRNGFSWAENLNRGFVVTRGDMRRDGISKPDHFQELSHDLPTSHYL